MSNHKTDDWTAAEFAILAAAGMRRGAAQQAPRRAGFKRSLVAIGHKIKQAARGFGAPNVAIKRLP